MMFPVEAVSSTADLIGLTGLDRTWEGESSVNDVCFLVQVHTPPAALCLGLSFCVFCTNDQPFVHRQNRKPQRTHPKAVSQRE